uniref:Uncharacterized protein n=1 Tax=Rhizophora mucronata TaxID=61149 RepID=A0A2P2Q720_RHIMU
MHRLMGTLYIRYLVIDCMSEVNFNFSTRFRVPQFLFGNWLMTSNG